MPWTAIPYVEPSVALGLFASADVLPVLDYAVSSAVTVEASAITEALGGYFEIATSSELAVDAAGDSLMVLSVAGDAAVSLSASSVSDGEVKVYPMGMDKSGTQVTTTNSTSSTANTVVGWVPTPAYSSTTTITDDQLVAAKTGNVTITATATITTAGSASHSRGIHLRVDGAIVATDQTTVGSQTSFTATWTGQLAAGQKVGMAAWVQASTAGYRNLTAAQITALPAY